MNRAILAVIVMVAVTIILSGIFAVIFITAEEKKEIYSVTIVNVERIEIKVSDGFLGTDMVSLPYITAETKEGETVMGIINISTLNEGDKILIMEDAPKNYHLSDRYKWYKFIGYQQPTDIEN
ncbi:hypothetical protein KAT63_04400 [Candidatus Parcubacteria bacterium]|nr:hypothetical protein [Candidatus Parcubacteria bacterium]